MIAKGIWKKIRAFLPEDIVQRIHAKLSPNRLDREDMLRWLGGRYVEFKVADMYDILNNVGDRQANGI